MFKKASNKRCSSGKLRWGSGKPSTNQLFLGLVQESKVENKVVEREVQALVLLLALQLVVLVVLLLLGLKQPQEVPQPQAVPLEEQVEVRERSKLDSPYQQQ